MIDNGFSKFVVSLDGSEPLDHHTSLLVQQSQLIIISDFVAKYLVMCKFRFLQFVELFFLSLNKKIILSFTADFSYSKTFVGLMSRMEA